jgi:small-conductance mechanosensitive channel
MTDSFVDKLNHELINQFNYLKQLFLTIELLPYLNACGYFLTGLLITLIVRWLIGTLTKKNISTHHSLLFRRITFYVGLTLSLIFPLKASGIDVSALLGAAGIVTAAVAFAAQTSISNFLSGVFLEAEKPFVIGDSVNINDVGGEVLSIDLLSVKIRTKDNTLVRIPNETLLKSQFQNVSRFPIRRFDIKFKVVFNDDLSKINQILMNTAANNPLCLVSPAPELSFVEFGDSGILLQFSVWGKQPSYSKLQTQIQMDIQVAFVGEGVKLPVTYASTIEGRA